MIAPTHAPAIGPHPGIRSTRRPSLVAVAWLWLVALLAGTALAGQWPAAAAAAGVRAARLASAPGLQTAAPTGRIVLQFTAAATAADRARIAALAGQTPSPRIPAEMLDHAAARSRGSTSALASLARYAEVAAPAADRGVLLRLVARLAADPAVTTAFLEPRAVPAALGFDAITGAVPAALARPPAPGRGTATPDFSDQQGYLDAAPLGIGARSAWDIPGGRAATVRIIDVEGAWLWAHEDLPEPFADLGGHVDDPAWRNHGTAVLGEIRGHDDGQGVTGLAPDAAVGASSVADQSFPAALLAAAAELEAGDIVLIELHAPGPNAFEGGGQFGYVPMEFWQDNFDAIRALTDLGIIVVEAAGNGQQDLDDPVYLGLFDRQQRDSGAIMVGATDGSALWPAWFSNHGARVDLSGWGLGVVTCGYGDLQGGEETAWYTAQFSGTSSASPIVVGAVASLQGMTEATWAFSLDAPLAREILRQTGTPVQGDQVVGPRPDLVAAWELVGQQGAALVTGTVTDAVSGLPVAAARVTVLPAGPHAICDDAGRYRLGLLPGDHELQVASYFHATRTDLLAVVPGINTNDPQLEPLPTETVAGTVLGAGGQPVAGAQVALLGEPFAPTWSGPDGRFAFAAVPVGNAHLLQAGLVPGHGGAAAMTSTAAPAHAGLADIETTLVLPATDHPFEAGPDGFTAAGGLWQHGRPAAAPLGPGAAFDGQWCWGIGLDGAGYPDAAADTLRSPIYHGPDFAADRLHLSFHWWSGTEPGFDGVHVAIEVPGSLPVVVGPAAGYTDLMLGGLDHQAGWSGHAAGWQVAVLDLTAWLAEPAWQILWIFGADAAVGGDGFLIDGVALEGGSAAVAAPDPAIASPPTLLSAWPNPFNPRVSLAWERPTAAPLDLAIHDLRGRLVRRLIAGAAAPARGQLVWDGRDASGQPLPSGVYLVRAATPGAGVAVRRVTLTR